MYTAFHYQTKKIFSIDIHPVGMDVIKKNQGVIESTLFIIGRL